jgi:hypothetical protein
VDRSSSGDPVKSPGSTIASGAWRLLGQEAKRLLKQQQPPSPCSTLLRSWTTTLATRMLTKEYTQRHRRNPAAFQGQLLQTAAAHSYCSMRHPPYMIQEGGSKSSRNCSMTVVKHCNTGNTVG